VKGYQRRIKALETARPPFADVLELIRQRTRYDELDEQQKSRYCQMIGTPRNVYEEIALDVVGDLHILLQRFDPPTPDELKEIIDELEQTTLSITDQKGK
jgi:hypothetical protein